MYILVSVFIYMMVDGLYLYVTALYTDSFLKAPVHCYAQAV